ncbi:MAG: 2-amino-4-hydroxy-6-hydroxymethyldihydropteridine diphosphokinase [Muribaculaceae bacterium]|nr:2-amino-4-hydroxy-6-hydroxymethyldihydropteridine diphosphokinase [Muribaculaceae bacterium]
MYAFINIGSNLGNRRLNLSKAIAAIEKRIGYFELSHTLETHPWGYISDKMFLNVGIAFQTEMTPEELLDTLQEIEKELNKNPHRADNGGYQDREIDIDIIALDRMEIDTERLKVPHPHLEERIFFLQPMAELAPDWTHPRTGLTPAQMIANLPQSESPQS